MFQAMDRLVYRGEQNSWALCVAMCSNRIAWHEGTPAENFEGVKTSQGMTYLYLPSDDTQFDDEFWATFDLTAPPGTTVDLTPLGPNPEGEWGANTPQNEWTGGTTFADLALAGMHLVAPGGTGLVARKTWFAAPDMIVALGSDLATSSGNEVRTVVEHRNLGVDKRTLLVDGTPVHERTSVAAPSWAHLDQVGGYVFLERPAHLSAEVAERQGTWQRNNTGTGPGTGEIQRRQYATLAISHGTGAAVEGGTYAYVLLPNSSVESTKAQAAKPAVAVLRNDSEVQAVRWTNVTAANFWKAATVGDFESTSSVCLLARKVPGMVRLSVSDPTQTQSTLNLSVSNIDVNRVTGVDAAHVTLTRTGSTAHLVIDVRGTAGATLEFALHQ
jgi:hyaluronate lyase